MNNEVPSLSDLMNRAFDLSLKIIYIPGGKGEVRQDDFAAPDEIDMIFGWADGLSHKYYQNMSTGHCSMQAMIDFDVEKFEKNVERDIKIMENILNKIGIKF